jgi:hypothetical protein
MDACGRVATSWVSPHGSTVNASLVCDIHAAEARAKGYVVAEMARPRFDYIRCLWPTDRGEAHDAPTV